MSRFLKSFSKDSSKDVPPATSRAPHEDEVQNLQEALSAVELIMNDEIDLAERKLEAGNSVFHHVRQAFFLRNGMA